MGRYVSAQNIAHALRMNVTTQANGPSGYTAGMRERGREKESRRRRKWVRKEKEKNGITGE